MLVAYLVIVGVSHGAVVQRHRRNLSMSGCSHLGLTYTEHCLVQFVAKPSNGTDVPQSATECGRQLHRRAEISARNLAINTVHMDTMVTCSHCQRCVRVTCLFDGRRRCVSHGGRALEKKCAVSLSQPPDAGLQGSSWKPSNWPKEAEPPR